MAQKIQTVYVCSNCDAQSPKWSGRCLECGAWGTLKTQTIDQKENAKKIDVPAAATTNLASIGQNSQDYYRLQTNIKEIDRVLGGGILPGSLILLSGEPGIGKSTIVAQIADAISREGDNQLIYASGEESIQQIKNRFDRLKINAEKINFISDNNTEKIVAAVSKMKPSLAIIDSIQTVYSSAVPSEPGSIGQIRASTVNFLEIAKKQNIPIILIGHITKDGVVAGPKSLEHIVDTVIYLEAEKNHDYRMLRATKNRFGSIDELGIFEMTSAGFKEISNPSLIFIESGTEKISGSVISCIMQGTRPFLVEIQSLVTKTVFGYPQRKASGFDLNRLQVLIAVLTKRAGINLTNQDVILNVVGGLKINDPSIDLAVCLAIASSLLNQTIDRKTIVLGEVGLGGEIRNVSKLEQKLKEAEKLGFTKAIIPDCNVKAKTIKLTKIKNLKELIKYFS